MTKIPLSRRHPDYLPSKKKKGERRPYNIAMRTNLRITTTMTTMRMTKTL
jgi:hypothetical protein